MVPQAEKFDVFEGVGHAIVFDQFDQRFWALSHRLLLIIYLDAQDRRAPLYDVSVEGWEKGDKNHDEKGFIVLVGLYYTVADGLAYLVLDYIGLVGYLVYALRDKELILNVHEVLRLFNQLNISIINGVLDLS